MSAIDSSLQATSYHDFGALGRLKGVASQDPKQALKETAQQFEAYFLQQMIKSMRDTIDKSDLVEQGQVGFYEELMDKEVALQMAKRGSLGLSGVLEQQMTRLAPSTQDVLSQRPQAMPLVKPADALPLQRPIETLRLPEQPMGLPLRRGESS
jgi:flagellar protein FlgJ